MFSIIIKECQCRGPSLTLHSKMFNNKSDNINLWIIILTLSHIIQDKYSIFNIRVSLVFSSHSPSEFPFCRVPWRQSRLLHSTSRSDYTWNVSPSSADYLQVAGTVILCDMSISVTSSYSDVRDLDLSCKTLYDESLPPATPEQLGELSESLEFFTKIGKELWL